MSTKYADVWDALDNAPEYAKEVASLISWSTNYDATKGTPYGVFLDLIGYSDEHFGESLVSEPHKVLGYMELAYLADALQEYTKAPSEVLDYIETINELENK